MPVQIFENSKGSEILNSLKEKIQTNPNKTYRIVCKVNTVKNIMGDSSKSIKIP